MLRNKHVIMFTEYFSTPLIRIISNITLEQINRGNETCVFGFITDLKIINNENVNKL